MNERPRRLRRSQLSVPGSNEKMLAKAAASAADHVFCDLEDSVALSAKVEARGKVIQALRTHEWKPKTRCVRINDLETAFAHDDIISIVTAAHDCLDTIMIPKVKSARDVLWVETLLVQLERKLGISRRIGLEVLIEEVEGMMWVEEIAASTPRLECLIFGMGDYSASQGIDSVFVNGGGTYPGDIWHYPRYKMTIAARANRLDAVDGPFADFRNEAAYREEAKRAQMLGCVGKWAIHPSQIQPALEIFSPKPKEVERARTLAKAYGEAQARGEGAVQVDGVMVDVASIRILQNTLDRAKLIGM
jgi:citrate lyase subunit beta / citryl-CoA lyase